MNVAARMRPGARLTVALTLAFLWQVGGQAPIHVYASTEHVTPSPRVALETPGTTVIPYQATGWIDQSVAFDAGAGFEAPSLVETSPPWTLSAQAAFGSGGGCPLQSTDHASWPTNTDLLVRRHVTELVAGQQGVQIWFAIDNDIIDVFWNGVRIGGGITHENCATLDSFGISVPATSVTGNDVLGVRARDRGSESFLDMSIIKNGLISEVAPDGTIRQENGTTGADPVQTFHGAFMYQHTDTAIPGRGPAIDFARSYNSADTRVGPMGPGWTISYNARIRDTGDGTGDLYLVRSDGNTDRFKRNNDETFSPSAAVYSTLIRNADESYTVTEKDQTRQDFDGAGRLTKITDRYGNVSTLGYNAGGQLATVADPAGRGSLTLAYAGSLLTSVTDWASPARTVTYQYDTSGRLWKVTDREGQITAFAYDGTSARITTITDARSHVALTLTYDAQGRVATQKDARGLTTGDVTTLAYVVNGDGTRVTTVTEPVTSFEPTFHPTVVDSYDANGWLTSRTSKPSSTETLTETYTYDATGNRTSVTDPRGNRTDFCYDASYAGTGLASRGNLTRTIAPAPTVGANRPVMLLAFDAKDNLVQTVAPKGVPSTSTTTCSTDLSTITTAYATDLAYDASAVKLLSATSRFTDPDFGLKTATTKYEYGDAANPGLATRIIPARGNTTGTPDYTYATTMTYFSTGSKAGLLSGTTDALGNFTTFDYDAVGRLTSTVDANGNAAGGVPADHTTNYVYDKEDRVRFVKLPAPIAGGAQLVNETRYDEVGNPIIRIDAIGQVVLSSFDERDALLQVKENPNAWNDPAAPPAGTITTEYAYDAAGNLTRMTRAKGDAANERVTDYAYDGRRLARRETQYPAWPTMTSTLVTTSSFDPNGNASTMLDPLGKSTTNAFDALNRQTSRTYSDGVTPAVGYSYDLNGNRTSMTDGTGSTSYAYDEANHLMSTTTPGPKTVAYRYDLDGNRTKLIYPDATAVTYSFNKSGQLSSLLDWASRSTTYTYFPNGTVKDATNVNTTVATYAYDNAARLTSIVNKLGAAVIDQRSYTLDAVGNVTAVSGIGGTADSTTRVSESTSHGQGNGVSDKAFISSDGRYVTFRSSASTLVAGDTNGANDIFVKDRLTNSTVAASSTAAGVIGNARSDDGSISADGRYVAFRSQASNLVANDTNGTAWDTFVKDLQTGSVDRVSVSSSGVQANGASIYTVLSADGRWVAFRSDASNLVSGDTNGVGDIFLRDRQTNTTTRISVATGGAQANGTSDRPTISNDGRYILYESAATNLVAGDTNAVTDLFLYDRIAATTTRVSLDGSGVQGNGLSDDGAISGDGSTVSFESDATNLVAGDTNAKTDVFVRTIATGVTVRGSLGAAAVQGNNISTDPSLSVDGKKLAFASTATNLVTGDTNNRSDVFIRDLVAGTTTRYSIADGGAQGNDTSQDPWLTGDGKTVAFASLATNLVTGDTNAASDIFVRGPGLDATTYGYDRLYRLTSVVGPDGSPTYAYDPVGNRTSKVIGGTTSSTYDRADRILTSGALNLAVNANGNTTAKGADTFTYDQANQLKSASVAGATETYVYDGDGTRFSRQIGAGTPIRYISDVNGSMPITIDDGTHKYVYGLGLAYAVSGSTIEVYHTDRLGSVRAITDATGAVTASYRTDEWGVPTSSTGSSTQLFRYTGEPQDATGLNYLRARYYDPSVGRFLTRDSVGASFTRVGGLNRYAYGDNDPTTRTDPTGHSSTSIVLGGRKFDLRQVDRALDVCGQQLGIDITRDMRQQFHQGLKNYFLRGEATSLEDLIAACTEMFAVEAEPEQQPATDPNHLCESDGDINCRMPGPLDQWLRPGGAPVPEGIPGMPPVTWPQWLPAPGFGFAFG